MGFSIIGTVIAILILFPSIIFYTIFPPKNPSIKIKEVNGVFTVLERLGQASCLLFLIMSGNYIRIDNINIFTVFMVICIVIYYFLWVRYIISGRDTRLMLKPFLLVPIPGAVFPVCAFTFAALWGNVPLLSIASLILGIGHFTVSWNTYKQIK
jgi:hypothetical protein